MRTDACRIIFYNNNPEKRMVLGKSKENRKNQENMSMMISLKTIYDIYINKVYVYNFTNAIAQFLEHNINIKDNNTVMYSK